MKSNSSELTEKFRQLLDRNTIDLNDGQINTLIEYLQLIQKWNKVHNLTAIRNPEQMLSKHLIDSLAILPYLQGPEILDVGTGAGLPGLVLAVACPDFSFTLVDSSQKRVAFLTQAVHHLKLSNVTPVCSRIEHLAGETTFDTITSRAFSEISQFLEGCSHKISKNGRFLAMKGNYPEAELATIGDQYLVEFIQPLQIQGIDGERHVVGIRLKGK